jgi:predicted  nucleic acid-binding Zn-ribbon protein
MNICPKCGSHNNTTAGGCADCGWNPVYYSNTRPIEDALNKRIAELEAERDEARTMVERLIEAGEMMIDDPAVRWFDVHYKWRKIVAEWKEAQ